MGESLAGRTEGERDDSRRSLLKKAGLVAGAAWVVPTVLSLDVPAASASPGTCTSCNSTLATAPEQVVNGTNPTATTGWAAPNTATDAPVTAQIAQVSGGVFVAASPSGNPALSGLQQVITFPTCAARFAAGGVTATLAATLDGKSAGGVNPPTGTNGAYVQVQFFNGATSVGSPIVIQTNTAAALSSSGSVPVNATRAVVAVYLVKNGSARATANNISLKIVC